MPNSSLSSRPLALHLLFPCPHGAGRKAVAVEAKAKAKAKAVFFSVLSNIVAGLRREEMRSEKKCYASKQPLASIN